MSAQTSGMKEYCQRLAMLLLTALPVTTVYAAELPPLQMGVLPYLSNERLFKNFLPIKDYLEAKLERRIVMSTAPNFKTYAQRAARGDYDIYQTAPHFALLAEAKHGYRRVAKLTRELNGNVVVRQDSPVQRVEDLRGRTVITPDALAITSMLGEQLLKEHGLSPERDYRLERSISYSSAIRALYRGAADAALTSATVYEHLPEDVKDDLRVLTKTSSVPHMMIMAHPRLSQTEYLRLKSALLEFTRDGAGQLFFETTGYGDMGPITDTDMKMLRPFLKTTQERLK